MTDKLPDDWTLAKCGFIRGTDRMHVRVEGGDLCIEWTETFDDYDGYGTEVRANDIPLSVIRALLEKEAK